MTETTTTTTLHQLMDQAKWNDVLDYTILSTAHEHVPRGQDLPLHMACERSAPDDTLLAMLHAHPKATHHPGRGDNTCLHIATHRNLSAVVIESLIRIYPEALDSLNAAQVTPRDIGQASLALQRPTLCWHQLMQDEIMEECQDERLKQLHSTMDDALIQLEQCEKSYNMQQRLHQINNRLSELEAMPTTKHAMMETLEQLTVSLQSSLESMDHRVSIVEDEIKAATAREFMGKAASRAQQTQVSRLQRAVAEESKLLQAHVESVTMKFAC